MIYLAVASFLVLGVFRPGLLVCLMFSGILVRGAGGAPLVSSLVQLVAFALICFHYLLKNNFKVPAQLKCVEIMYVMFVIVFCSSLFLSPGREAPLLLTAVWTVVFSYIVGKLITQEENLDQFGLDFTFGIAVLVLVAVLSSGLTANSSSLAPYRASLGDVRAVGFAAVLNVLISSALGTISYKVTSSTIRKSRKELILISTIAALGVYLAILNGTRGLFVGLIIALIARICFAKRRALAINISIFLIVLSAVYPFGMFVRYLIAQLTEVGFNDRIIGALTLIERAILGGSQGQFDASLNDRQLIWQKTWEGIAERPIFGHGALSANVDLNTYPHNFFLEYWYDFGLIGIAVFAIVFLVTLQKSLAVFSNKNATRTHHISAMILISFLVQSQISYSVYMLDVITIFGPLIWIGVSSKKKPDNSGFNQQVGRRFAHNN